MNTPVSPQAAAAQAIVLPKNRGAYYGGAWHEPKAGRFIDTMSPGTGLSPAETGAARLPFKLLVWPAGGAEAGAEC